MKMKVGLYFIYSLLLLLTVSCQNNANSNDTIVVYNVSASENNNSLHSSMQSAFNKIANEATNSNTDSEYKIYLSGGVYEGNITFSYLGEKKLTIQIAGINDSSKIDALNSSSVLSFNGKNLKIILGNNLILTNGLSSEGGGVQVIDSELVIDGTTITNNKAYFAGGGLYVKNGVLHIKSGSIHNNIATGKGDSTIGASDSFVGHGGGIYVTGTMTPNIIEYAYFDFSGGNIEHNNATSPYGGGSGGGVYLNYNTEATISGNATIAHNTSDYFAGLSAYFASVDLKGGVISSNISKYTQEQVGIYP